MAKTHKGTCFCGSVEIEVSGKPMEMGYCHCTSCRHYSGAPFVAFILWRANQVRVTRGEALLGRFNKAAMSERRFCRRCGGHVMSELRPSVSPTYTRPCSRACASGPRST